MIWGGGEGDLDFSLSKSRVMQRCALGLLFALRFACTSGGSSGTLVSRLSGDCGEPGTIASSTAAISMLADPIFVGQLPLQLIK
jgi:hypothetical protein